MNDVFSSDQRPRHSTSARDFDDYTTISKVSKLNFSQRNFSKFKVLRVYFRTRVQFRKTSSGQGRGHRKIMRSLIDFHQCVSVVQKLLA